MSRLDDIQARIEAASPDDWNWASHLDESPWFEMYCGPWVNGYRTGAAFGWTENGEDGGGQRPSAGDANFIAHARQDVPDLLNVARAAAWHLEKNSEVSALRLRLALAKADHYPTAEDMNTKQATA